MVISGFSAHATPRTDSSRSFPSLSVSTLDYSASVTSNISIDYPVSFAVTDIVHACPHRASGLHGVSSPLLVPASLSSETTLARFRAYVDASRNGLARFELPIIGALANQWVQDE
jgi:hypothetical protein